jgi:hypothetical protein
VPGNVAVCLISCCCRRHEQLSGVNQEGRGANRANQTLPVLVWSAELGGRPTGQCRLFVSRGAGC